MEQLMKFIHVSDVHLGIKPDEGKPWSEKRAQDIWDSFAEVIEASVELKPDFLLISGDLFHAQPLKKELREVNYLFGRIPQTKIILMAGNHDYLRTKSYYLTMEWEENVYFFRQEEPGHFDFEEENVSIYGLSYWHREIGEPVYDSIIPEDLSKINILLVHGGDPQHIPYHPKHILENGFDYIAAGHIHKGGQQIPGRAVMAGSLEPTDKNDVGSHGYWLGTIDKEHTDIHFHPVKKCEYCHEVYPVTGKTTNFEICEWAKTLLAERPGYQYSRLFLRGKVSPDTEFDTAKLEEFDRVVDVTEQLSPDYDYEKLKENYKDTLLGNYIEEMERRPQDVVTKKALEYGVNALLGYKICR